MKTERQIEDENRMKLFIPKDPRMWWIVIITIVLIIVVKSC